MRSFNGVELKIGQRVVINEDDEYLNRFIYGIIRVLDNPNEVAHVDVPCDDYGRNRSPRDIIVLPEEKV